MKDIFPTKITPYRADGSVDYDTAEKYVDWYFANGMTGIFAVCQSSEIFYLSLGEKAELNRRVYRRAKALEKQSGRRFTVVSSGHTSDAFEDQVRELNAVCEAGTDALILITNRLDPNNEGDDVFIANGKKLLAALPREVKLGLYECPHPYKRLVTEKTLKWAVSTGRFRYMKDTCCDAAVIAERVKWLAGSGFALLNANCQTLLETLKSGADGYCGIMANFHPKLYAWLCHEFENQPDKAALVQGVIGTFGFIEGGLPYPLTAKYHMTLEGLKTRDYARSRPGEALSDYGKGCVEQMRLVTKQMESELGL